jgi:predicted secreted Zn-dependent protease
MMFSTLFLVALLSQAAPPPPNAPLATDRLRAAAPGLADRPNTTLHGYPVSGRTRRGVRAAMQADRPSDLTGQRHDAVVQWRYSFQMHGGRGGCQPERSEVLLAAIVVLPDLVEPERLNRSDRTAWNAYFERLVAHETNHLRIAELGARRLQEVMRAAPNCETANAAARAENDAIAEASAEYDRVTGHGRTEGVVF